MTDEARARKQEHIAAHYTRLRPSEVFGERLREVRRARGLSQTELAYSVDSRGVPMNKAALLRIESRERGLSLDEAIAITAALPAAPAHMLTPPNDAYLKLDDKIAIDGEGVREWLRGGFPWVAPVPDEVREDSRRSDFQLRLAHFALTLVDALRGDDKVGLREAESAIVREVLRREKEKGANDA